MFESESKSCSNMSNSLKPHGLYSPWNSSGQNTGVGSLSLLQWIFPTYGSNTGLLHCRQILDQLSHKRSPKLLEWVAYPFSSGSSWPRNQTGASCISGGFFELIIYIDESLTDIPETQAERKLFLIITVFMKSYYYWCCCKYLLFFPCLPPSNLNAGSYIQVIIILTTEMNHNLKGGKYVYSASLYFKYNSLKTTDRDFPVGPEVKTLSFQCKECGLNPWLEN